jgi:hypothetical protein
VAKLTNDSLFFKNATQGGGGLMFSFWRWWSGRWIAMDGDDRWWFPKNDFVFFLFVLCPN